MSKKLSKSIGIICKLRHFVNIQTLIQSTVLCYCFSISHLRLYGLGSTYITNIKPLEILQKRTIRVINFAKFDAHTNPLFAQHKLMKLQDIIFLYTACFMYHFSKSNLPNAFNNFFTPINTRHKYNTRLASKSTFAFPIIRTNYGRFNIRFFGPKVWNEI